MYYQCTNGCVTHETCQDDFLFHDLYRWCMFNTDVECGERPCNDPLHCPNLFTSTTPESTTTYCGHQFDCSSTGDGYFADPFNCRKYWHCYRGEGESNICPDDQLWDDIYKYCTYPIEVTCGERPICGPCDEDCTFPPTTPPDCGHSFDCSSLPGGYYADPFNCRKYWHCEEDYSPAATHTTCDGSLLYDDINVACDFPEYVNCGDRPVCGDCDEDCGPQA